jgi:profilin
MAFLPYTEALVESGAMHAASIIGLADGSYWAYTGPYVPQPAEAQHIIACVKDPSKARMEGVRIHGHKFFVMRAEPELLIGKLGNGGFIACKSEQAVTISVFGGDSQPMHGALREVENMAASFRELMY